MCGANLCNKGGFCSICCAKNAELIRKEFTAFSKDIRRERLIRCFMRAACHELSSRLKNKGTLELGEAVGVARTLYTGWLTPVEVKAALSKNCKVVVERSD
jgi:hypothetical protein